MQVATVYILNDWLAWGRNFLFGTHAEPTPELTPELTPEPKLEEPRLGTLQNHYTPTHPSRGSSMQLQPGKL